VSEYQFHEVANIFPLMSDEELGALTQDIKANGLHEAICMHGDKIIDGRNRYRACLAAGVEPHYRHWDGVGSLVTYIISLNLHRRHLTSSQRAAVAVDILPMLEAEAKERQAENMRRNQIQNSQNFDYSEQVITPPGDGRSTEQAGNMAGVNRQYVSDAKKLKESAPVIFEQVRRGEVTIAEAKKAEKKKEQAVARAERAASAPAMPRIAGKPELVLADPPWRYDFAETNNREIENQYPTATVEEIISHRPDTADDCVLLLWATAPKLREALQVMAGWQFEFKTCAVWDKQIIGMGYWFRGQHELLLVGTRGNARPPNQEDRVSSVFCERRKEHSQKPECVYQWIESAFTGLIKLEMYCRNPRAGWQVWGNGL
jgi:N6-adenosine-specific RNA methylase IME4